MVGSQSLVAFANSSGGVRAYTSPISSYNTQLVEGRLSFNVSKISGEFSSNTNEMIIFITLELPEGRTGFTQVWQVGPVSGGTPRVHKFDPANKNSVGKVDFISGQTSSGGGAGNSKQRRRNVHGVLNVVSWGILLPLGALTARYLKVFKSADLAWFYLHAVCQSSAYIVGVVGWGTGLKLGSDSPGIQYDKHRNIGITLFCLGTLQGAIFDIVRSGARGDGRTDDSQAIMRAWKDACASPQASKVLIPKGTYMVVAVTFQGPCKAPITVQSQGTWKAPTDPAKQKSQDGWIIFQNINALTFTGGVYDGQGALAWTQNNCAKTGKCSSLPMNFRFNAVTNSLVQGISSLNSKLFHMNLINCKNVAFVQVTINAPENSLNTDGIHIGRSSGINITDSNIKTGDDCVSLGDGSQQVLVQKVTCGPGHGISVGSLGKYQNEEPVEGVTVKNCTFTNTMNGVRVKTWPASPNGVARDMHFEDLIMNNVNTPILIDQEYCPYNQCQLQNPSKVKISDVTFKGIRGTSATKLAVKLVCSKGLPCQNVKVSDINLVYNGNDGAAISQCSNVKPAISGKLFPPTCAKSA